MNAVAGDTRDAVTEVEARSTRRPPVPPGVGRRRAVLGAAAIAVTVASVAALTGSSGIVNAGGWPQLRSFLVAAVHPDVSAQFLRLTWEATLTTVAYAVLGTVVAMMFGLVGGVLLAETWWRRSPHPGASPRPGWYVTRGLVTLPRGVHEAVWGLLLVSVLGLDPLVGILAIGIPFGAVSAKVISELVDEAAGGTYTALRATGAGRVAALLCGVLPVAGGDIVSYGFYRLECAIRAAAVLGVIGAGGLGFQLALSFQALRYEEMWTLIFALVAVSGLADLWSSRLRLRRDHDTRIIRVSLALAALLVILSLAHLDVDPASLWAADARLLAARMARDAWPPSLAGTGMADLVRMSLETLSMSVIGIAAATAAAVPVAFVAARGGGGVRRAVSVSARAVLLVTRAVLLVTRAVPPPVWAFVLLLVLFPGSLPGVAALAVYNFGILGVSWPRSSRTSTSVPPRRCGRLARPTRTRSCTACCPRPRPGSPPTRCTAGRWHCARP